MHYFIAVILFMLLENSIDVSAQNPASASPAGGTAVGTAVRSEPCQPSDLTLVGKGKDGTDFLFRMDESLQIKASGGCYAWMKEQFAKAEGSRGIKLLLDDVIMANLPMTPSENVSANQLILAFHLKRNSQDDDNRKTWDTLLGKQHGTYEFTPRVALAVGNEPARGVQSASTFRLYIAKREAALGILAVGVVIFLVVYYLLAKNPTVLRDATNGPYSLGKSQMAFWGLLVVLTFAGIWSLTGAMERIPQQVLILIGISGATGLSSILIGKSKKSDEIASLQAEQQTLENQKLTATAAFPPGSEARLVEVKSRIDALSQVPPSTDTLELQNEIAKLQAEQQTLEKQKLTAAGMFPPLKEARLAEVNSRIAELKQEAQSAGFWQDICDDGNGMSFHRLQAVIWTVVLGIIFVDSVSQAISMPEFSETLLVLLGISNGTYLGFKFPEKT